LQIATTAVEADFPFMHPIWLGLALNLLVFYYEILNLPKRFKFILSVWTVEICSCFQFDGGIGFGFVFQPELHVGLIWVLSMIDYWLSKFLTEIRFCFNHIKFSYILLFELILHLCYCIIYRLISFYLVGSCSEGGT
jgi:hypothetical protein